MAGKGRPVGSFSRENEAVLLGLRFRPSVTVQLRCGEAPHEHSDKGAGGGPSSERYVCPAQSSWVVPLKSVNGAVSVIKDQEWLKHLTERQHLTGLTDFLPETPGFLCYSCCWMWNHSSSNISSEKEIRRCLYLPSQLLLDTGCLGEMGGKNLNTEDFWAVTQISWTASPSASPSSCREQEGRD